MFVVSFERKESSRKGLSDLFLENKIYHIKLAISRDYPCAKNKWHVSHHGEMSIKFNRCEEKLETGSLRRRIIPKFVDHNNTRRKQGNKSYSRVYRWPLAVTNNRRAWLMSSIDTSNNRNEGRHWPFPCWTENRLGKSLFYVPNSRGTRFDYETISTPFSIG